MGSLDGPSLHLLRTSLGVAHRHSGGRYDFWRSPERQLRTGRSQRANDINGDGMADVIVGADQLFANAGSGKAYVRRRAAQVATFKQPAAGAIPDRRSGPRPVSAAAVTSVGDFNGDGFSDVTVGASENHFLARSGRAYTFFGPLAGTIPAASADSIVTGSSLDELGFSVAGGDFNGDGAPDLVIGAPQFATGAHGYAAMFFGSAALQSLTSLSLTPRGDPIIIPPNGGSFRFRLDLANLAADSRTIDIAVTLTGPGTQRSIEQLSRTLSAGELVQHSSPPEFPAAPSRHIHRHCYSQCFPTRRSKRQLRPSRRLSNRQNPNSLA